MRRWNERGFTMVELLVVVLILGIIGMLVIPKFLSQPDKAREAVVQTDLKTIQSALQMYQIENPDSKFPGENDVGGVLCEAGIQWTGEEDGIRDPWEGAYVYYLTEDEDEFVVTSTGRQSEDDSNWYITAKGDPKEWDTEEFEGGTKGTSQSYQSEEPND